MHPTRYNLFLRDFVIEVRIGIHDFERAGAQRLTIGIELDIDPALLPSRDDIVGTFDYDWVRDEVKLLAASRHFELQETLVQAIVARLASRPEIERVVVETAKPDVYPDVAAVGCRIEARRQRPAPVSPS
jgi:dihydroneopterin aldolase